MESPFEQWFLAEDPQGRLHGYLSYHAAAHQPLARRRLHRRFWLEDGGFVPGHLDRKVQGIWSSPAGPIILRDRPPGWRIELYDWTFQKRNQFDMPGPASRLEYLLRGLTVGENDTLFLHGDGEDFRHIYRWSGELKAETAISANEGMVGAWVRGALAYGGWSGELTWPHCKPHRLGAPIEQIQSKPDSSWVLVLAGRTILLHLEDGRQRDIGKGCVATFTHEGVAWADHCLHQQALETGEDLSVQPLSSPVIGLQWLPRRGLLAALHYDEIVRFYEPVSSRLHSQLDLRGALPALPTRTSMPFDFSGQAQFHQDGRLRSLSSDGYRLQLSPSHDSGSANSGDDGVEQRYYANGTVEQFSSMDDNSEPHPVPFQDWVQRWLADILGPL